MCGDKIIIIGCPGSGKSTFARALHKITELPLFYLDRLYWNEDRTTVPKEVFRQRLQDVLGQERWIIDGNYGSTMELRMQSCDTVVFLDYPMEVCLEGIRTRFGKAREDIPWVETEPDAEFIQFIQDFREESRPRILELLEKHPKKRVITFHARQEANDWLGELAEAHAF